MVVMGLYGLVIDRQHPVGFGPYGVQSICIISLAINSRAQWTLIAVFPRHYPSYTASIIDVLIFSV